MILGADPLGIERSNLLTVFKLVVKELIDSSLSHGRMLDDNNVPLQQFFVILEHILRHGIKRKIYFYIDPIFMVCIFLDTIICLIEAPGVIARSNLIAWSKS